MNASSIALLAAAVVFASFIAVQAIWPLFSRRGLRPEIKAKLMKSLAAGKDASRPGAQRAADYREAFAVATEARKPQLALRYALAAERLDPGGDPATITFITESMRRTRKHKALERFLWQVLDRHRETPAHVDSAFDALIALYEGPLHAPERARVLRTMAERAQR